MSVEEQLDAAYTELFTLYGEYTHMMKQLDATMADGWENLVDAEREGRGFLDVSIKGFNLEDLVACTSIAFSGVNNGEFSDFTSPTPEEPVVSTNTSLSFSVVSDCDVSTMKLATRDEKTTNTSSTGSGKDTSDSSSEDASPEQCLSVVKPTNDKADAVDNPEASAEVAAEANEEEEEEEEEGEEENTSLLRRRGAKPTVSAGTGTTVTTASSPSATNTTTTTTPAATTNTNTTSSSSSPSPSSLKKILNTLTRVPPVPLAVAQQTFVDATRLASDIAMLRMRLVAAIEKAEMLHKQLD